MNGDTVAECSYQYVEKLEGNHAPRCWNVGLSKDFGADVERTSNQINWFVIDLTDLIIQRNLPDTSSSYSETVKANSFNLSIEAIFSMDQPPSRIVVDLNDYSAAFTMELPVDQ